ncbi:unnamed protein product [Notodromas monacha]|uniref:Major facilitator superfamily (MFS) profile domain-containing protein n=1 Tax=Notodromas monacha TaxID=399045 RepID=A0A7R9BFU4_9CRUS|nr:unnamed protein product [Notodromas monacha]CAG0913380.1 unnamed protein product [Notodromas monacha]
MSSIELQESSSEPSSPAVMANQKKSSSVFSQLSLMKQDLTGFLVYAIICAVLGMFQFGFNTGVINAPQDLIKSFIADIWKDRYEKDIDGSKLDFLWSVAVSIFAIGGMIGGFSGGFVANHFGRRGGLLMNNVLGVIGGCLLGFAKSAFSYEMLIFGRFLIGVNCGLNTSLAPMYISEISPLNLRGGLGVVNQLAVTIGLLLSQILGIEQILGTASGWPILLGLALCPAVIQLVLLPMCPESPRYLLILRNREDDARKALTRLRNSLDVEDDLQEMRKEERIHSQEPEVSMMKLITSKSLRMPLIISVIMQLSQQLSGINAVFYYSVGFFESAGLSALAARGATIGVGAEMVIMTIVSIPLMESAGRRTLHLFGLGGMFIFSLFITVSLLLRATMEWASYLSVICTLCFVVFFAVGPGSIPWMITAELFSTGPRPAAMSIAVLINWLANFAVGISVPPLQRLLEDYTFVPFTVLLGGFWVFTYMFVPETRGKTFEEISRLFRRDEPKTRFVSEFIFIKSPGLLMVMLTEISHALKYL